MQRQFSSNGPLFEELLAKLTASWQPLQDKPEENPKSTLRALWLYVCDNPTSVQNLDDSELQFLDAMRASRLRELVDRRISSVPLAYLTGLQSFMGVELLAGPEAIIPRKETEILASAAVVRLKEIVQKRGTAKILDLCTGSGNLALALASQEPHCEVFGADISGEAVALAERNAKHLDLDRRVRFVQGDLFTPFESPEFLGNLDLVICNPPYISSAKVELMDYEISGFEPRLAFDGGPFGVRILTRLIREAPRFLKPDSWLGFELGLGQGKAMAQMLDSNPHYRLVEPCTDSQGKVRALLARTRVDNGGM